jgi:hypothetical protein
MHVCPGSPNWREVLPSMRHSRRLQLWVYISYIQKIRTYLCEAVLASCNLAWRRTRTRSRHLWLRYALASLAGFKQDIHDVYAVRWNILAYLSNVISKHASQLEIEIAVHTYTLLGRGVDAWSCPLYKQAVANARGTLGSHASTQQAKPC